MPFCSADLYDTLKEREIVMHKIALLILVCLSVAATGCASMFLHGGRLAGRGEPTTGAIGAWRLTGCVDTAGNPQAPPELSYYLFRRDTGLELFERSSDGSGAVITNQWADANGTHFYTWVQSNGWEYTVAGPGLPIVRTVYAGTRSEAASDGSVRPTGAGAVVCTLD